MPANCVFSGLWMPRYVINYTGETVVWRSNQTDDCIFFKRDSSSVLTKDLVNPRRNLKRFTHIWVALCWYVSRKNPCAGGKWGAIKSTRGISRKPLNKTQRDVTLDLPDNERSNHISTEMRKLVETHNILTFKSFPRDITGKCTEIICFKFRGWATWKEI